MTKIKKRFLRPRDQRLVAKAQSATVKSKSCEGLKSPTLRRAWPRDGPEAAICVQGIDVQCVLQFTLIHAAGCALHRRTSRVIHRSKLCFFFFVQRVCSRARSQSNNFFFSKMKKGNEALRAPGEAPEEGKGGHTFKKKGDSLNLALPTSNGRSSRRETESISRRRYPNPSEKSNVGRSPP